MNRYSLKVILLGPTAAGKTAVSLQLAKRIGAEIVSVDSRQCYRYLDIGTATPSADELRLVPHHNISIIDPKERDSVADFLDRARVWEGEIRSRGKTVLYAGGSTLHLQSLIKPLDDLPEADPDHVSELEEQIREQGIDPLYDRLKAVDPEYAGEMDGKNPQRIVRALDVWKQTGQPFSSFHTGRRASVPDDTVVIGLRRDRQVLYDRINERVDRMFALGFLDEVESLLEAGYRVTDPGMNTVGYKQAVAFLQGSLSRSEMVQQMKAKTRQYAKRQLTWFRRWDFIRWIDHDRYAVEEVVERVQKALAAKANKE